MTDEDLAGLVSNRPLRDGTAVTVRPIRPGDAALERAFLAGLSMRTRYQRLLSARGLLPGEFRRLIHVDYRSDMALIATVGAWGAEVQVGVARYVRLEDARHAEFAIVIADAWQGCGLGTLLLSSLFEAARRHGVDALIGLTLTTNSAMLALARRLGCSMRMEPDDATLTRVSLSVGGTVQPPRAAFQG
jgi:GNAT superfamily N-acetyltransferase